MIAGRLLGFPKSSSACPGEDGIPVGPPFCQLADKHPATHLLHSSMFVYARGYVAAG